MRKRLPFHQVLMVSMVGLPAFAAIARAAELSNNVANATAGAETATMDRWLAASFTMDASNTSLLSSVTLLLANTSPGAAELDLHAGDGLEPGAFITTLTSPDGFSATPEAATFSAGGLTLAAGTTYWVVLRPLGGTFEWAWTADNTGSGVGFEATWDVSEDGGAAWYTHDLYPLQLAVAVADDGGMATFLRGDANRDVKVDLSDAVSTFGYLFLGAATPPCLDAADADDSGEVQITDPIFLLGTLFLGESTIPPPHPGCGQDPTAADGLGCVEGCPQA